MDSRKRLWIATTNGTCRYTDQDNFCQIPINVPYNNRNGHQFIESKDGKIFLNMVVHLCVYNPETDTFNRIFINFDPDKTYKQTCYIDNNNCLWAVNPVSIRCYDSRNMQLTDSIPMPQKIPTLTCTTIPPYGWQARTDSSYSIPKAKDSKRLPKQ